jgi:N-glycosylase/DNA lyase
MGFVPWLDFWREFWSTPPACKLKSECNLDELARALAEYLESAREVAIGAAKNVEDAERLMHALDELMERKKKTARHPH